MRLKITSDVKKISDVTLGTVQYLKRVMTSPKDSVRSQSLDGKTLRRLYQSSLYELILSTSFNSRFLCSLRLVWLSLISHWRSGSLHMCILSAAQSVYLLAPCSWSLPGSAFLLAPAPAPKRLQHSRENTNII